MEAPVVEAPVVVAVAAPATEPPGHAGALHTHCENCGTHLEGPWCHRCGQHDFEFHRSFRHVFWEAMENFLHFEGKFFRNIIVLLFRPGRLTAEFNAGKRAAQMPPFRLYLFVSVLFFFLVFIAIEPADVVQQDEPPPSGLNQARAVPAAGHNAAPENDLVFGKEGEKNAFEQWVETQGRRALDPVHRKEMGAAFLHSAPKMLLFCLPFFALFTRVLFRKSGQVYLQHLVLALHFHTFIFLWVMTRDGWGFLAGFASLGVKGWVLFACNLWLVLYPPLMLRSLFANSWPKTLLKTALLAFAYLLTLGGAFMVTAIIFLALL